MQKILMPKIDGSNNLDQVCDNDLDFFLLFYSTVCVVGNLGQANYGAANDYMQSLSRQRRKRGLAASVVDIGRVAGIGYVETAGKTVVRQLNRMGLIAISESGIHQLLAVTILAGYSNPKDKEVIPNAVVTTYIGAVRDEGDI